jgi:hypothetical protein
MATFRNVSGQLVDIPAHDIRVPDGKTFEVSAEIAETLASNPHFEQVKKSTKATPAETDGSI